MSDDRTSSHKCGDCGKVFATKYNLDRHIQYIHEDSDVESNSDLSDNEDSDVESNSDLSDDESYSDNESNSEEVSEVTTDEEDSEDMEVENSDNEESAFDDLIQQSKLPYEEKRVELAETYMVENDMDKEEALQAADNDLKHFYRKKLRHVFICYIDGMFDKRETALMKSILKKIKSLKADGFDEDEAIRIAVSFRKHAIYKLIDG